MKRLVKYIFCLKAYYFGLVAIHRLIHRRKTPLVLTYHRVIPRSKIGECMSQAGMVVTSETFEKQVGYLKRRYEIVPLIDLIEQAASGKPIDRLCAITFDDGWRDTHSEAYPILKKHRIPATVFVTSAYVGTDRLFWPERLTAALLRARPGSIRTQDVWQRHPALSSLIDDVLASEDRTRRLEALDKLILALKRENEAMRGTILESLGVTEEDGQEPQPGNRLMLNWQEVREMSISGFAIGSHTANHVILTQVSSEVAESEIVSSKLDIERNLGNPVTLFAYPNGDWNPAVKRAVQDSGYLAAVVTSNPPDSQTMDRFAVGRLNIHEGTFAAPSGEFSKAVFATEISGVIDWLRPPRSKKDY